MNELDKLIRELEGVDYYAYHEEPERKWSKRWTIFYGWPAAIFLMGLGAVVCAVWKHFA